ncbi:arylsulfotransferase family protein [Kitasatospora viridis]|uniref:Arylsulfotransferase ASST n=1 Tax=Kitasatospora viridis TaxID=281105 RepID=A0A561UQ95_9ACTN|nr:arylsulfotransferase family protein [Kitasatospora viridis]TWG01524.1 arylsulfotransferase ASST [Kitasatospora viridis]
MPKLRPALVLGAATAAVLATALPAGAATTAAPADTRPLPPVQVLTDRPGTAAGDIFLSPISANSAYASGVEILSHDGKRVVWSHQVPAGQEAADFRKQTYEGRPVLTWWQGTGLGGPASGVDEIYDEHYRKIAEVHAGNGYTADGHEFLITPQNTALILAYSVTTADLRSIGGPANQKVIDGVVQEVDIRTGKVLFQWNSADHVPYAQSEQPLPASADQPWDWFHVNAVKLDTDGSLLVDARNTWTTYQVDRRSGRINWQLGGKASSFTLHTANGTQLNDAGAPFSWQHDPEPLGGGRYSFFDNESAGVANTGAGAVEELPYSRVVTVQLDPRTHRATVVRTEDQPYGLSASSQGNAQPLRGGHTFVGWGSLPYVSEFDRSGRVLFDAQFPAGVNTYRAYRFPWK